jgi:hypothetical protein
MVLSLAGQCDNPAVHILEKSRRANSTDLRAFIVIAESKTQQKMIILREFL